MIRTKERLVQWIKLSSGTLKVNIDNSYFGNLGCTGIEGLIRNELGRRIIDFAGQIGISSNMHVELTVIWQGLLTAIDLQEVNLELELDSLEE